MQKIKIFTNISFLFKYMSRMCPLFQIKGVINILFNYIK